MQLSDYQKIYFLGIKGAGMTALAGVFQAMGKQVSGSDVPEVFFTDEVLARAGILVLTPFAEAHINSEIDLVVYSTAYGESNEEYAAAKKLHLPLISYPEALGLLFADKYGIAVCGTHGKTTTTAMLGYVLQELGQDPTVVVGSEVEQLGGSARLGQSKYLVVEADEYQNKLQYYNPQVVVLTSADWDHPDYFKDQAAYNQVFKDFVARIPVDGWLIAFTADDNVREIIKSAKCRVVEYGGQSRVPSPESRVPKLLLPGEHNVWNAMAVLTLIKELGLDVDRAKAALAAFKGAKRRFELLGEKNGIKVYDDYAHHPTEVKKMLAGARQRFAQKKIWAVFQPHTYTRTKALLSDFGKSFASADQVIILPIFGSAREQQSTVTPQELVEEINKNSQNASFRGTIKEVIEYLAKEVKSGDVVISIGAGENWRVGVGLLNSI